MKVRDILLYNNISNSRCSMSLFVAPRDILRVPPLREARKESELKFKESSAENIPQPYA